METVYRVTKEEVETLIEGTGWSITSEQKAEIVERVRSQFSAMDLLQDFIEAEVEQL